MDLVDFVGSTNPSIFLLHVPPIMSKIIITYSRKPRRSRIVIGDVVWQGNLDDPAPRFLKELREYVQSMHPVDLANFKALTMYKWKGYSFIRDLPNSRYAAMLRIAHMIQGYFQ